MSTGQCKRCYTNKMNRNKAHPAGMDGITTTLVQRVYGETVVKAMHCIATKTRQEKEMQEDWENSTIVPLYKSNGFFTRGCKNYAGICLYRAFQGKSTPKL